MYDKNFNPRVHLYNFALNVINKYGCVVQFLYLRIFSDEAVFPFVEYTVTRDIKYGGVFRSETPAPPVEKVSQNES